MKGILILFYPSIWMIIITIIKYIFKRKNIDMNNSFWEKFDEYNEPKYFWLIYQIIWLIVLLLINSLFSNVVH